MRLARGLSAALLVASMVAPARADEAADLAVAKQHYQKASALFDLEHYDEAIKEYDAAYQLRNDPSFLFNIAQAHRKARHYGDALHFYRAYLARESNPQNRERVEARIHELEAELARHPEAPRPEPQQPPAQPPAPQPQPQLVTAPAKADVAPPRHPRPRLIGGVVSGVVGVGLVAGGIALTVLASNAANKLTAADASHAPYDPSLYSTSQNDAIGGGVMLGVGALALATGAALIAIDIKRERARSNLASR